jgi:hypothetical protein
LFMEEWFVKRRGFAFGIMWVCISIPPPFPPRNSGGLLLNISFCRQEQVSPASSYPYSCNGLSTPTASAQPCASGPLCCCC